MDDGPREKRLQSLRAKLAARTDQPGYEKNVEAIKAEIATLEKAANGSEFDL